MHGRMLVGALLCAVVAAVAPAAVLHAQTAPATLTVTSPAFGNGEPIPQEYTGLGKNVSPAINWSGAPASTREFAVIVDDPDANFAGRGPFVHWVIYKIPASAKGLPEAVPFGVNVTVPGIAGAINGLSGFNAFQRPGQPPLEAGYRGPSPPAGPPHHYHFTVYALSTALEAKEGLDKAALLKAMEGRIAAQGEIIGVYQR